MNKQEQEENLSIEEFPSIHWKKFFDKFEDIQNLPITDWKAVHLIGYFCKRYFDYYGLKFSFKFNSNSPSKSYELVQFRKIAHMLSISPLIIKDYIDWFFDNKIIIKKKRITSLAYLSDANVINEFKFKKLFINTGALIDRSLPLPLNIIDIFKNHKYNNINTYGDFTWLHNASQTDYVLKNSTAKLFQDLENNGFNFDTLKKVK